MGAWHWLDQLRSRYRQLRRRHHDLTQHHQHERPLRAPQWEGNAGRVRYSVPEIATIDVACALRHVGRLPACGAYITSSERLAHANTAASASRILEGGGYERAV